MAVTKAWEPDDWKMMNTYQPGPGKDICNIFLTFVIKGYENVFRNEPHVELPKQESTLPVISCIFSYWHGMMLLASFQ